jgi:hypothetical protein
VPPAVPHHRHERRTWPFPTRADLTVAARHRADTGRADGLLVVAPLKIPGGTGSPVNPIWIV